MRGVLTFCAFVVAGSAAGAQEYFGFQSPTGNIHCMVFSGYGDDGDGVRCDIGNFTPSALPAPEGCDYDWGNAFWIGSVDRRGGLACISDAISDPGNSVLGYGESVSGGGVTCTSAKSGMTCENSAGHGFTLSKAKQRVF